METIGSMRLKYSQLSLRIYHTINGGNSNILVSFGRLIIDFLTAGTFLFKYNVQNQLPLFGNPHPFVSKEFQNFIFLSGNSNQSFVLHPEQPPQFPLQPLQLFPDFLSFQILCAAAAAIARTISPTNKVPITLSPFLSHLPSG